MAPSVVDRVQTLELAAIALGEELDTESPSAKFDTLRTRSDAILAVPKCLKEHGRPSHTESRRSAHRFPFCQRGDGLPHHDECQGCAVVGDMGVKNAAHHELVEPPLVPGQLTSQAIDMDCGRGDLLRDELI